jgi:hypothetical protein
VEVNHVGGDNRPGDVLVCVGASSVCGVTLKIVVEARDRQAAMGRKQISETMTTAMSERAGSAGVYVSRSGDGLAREIADWAEGVCERGLYVACTHEHLITAIRFLVSAARLDAMRASVPTINTSSVEAQIQRVRTALRRITAINTKAGEVRGSADAIRQEAEALRDEVRGALTDIEDILRTIPASTPTIASAMPELAESVPMSSPAGHNAGIPVAG